MKRRMPKWEVSSMIARRIASQMRRCGTFTKGEYHKNISFTLTAVSSNSGKIRLHLPSALCTAYIATTLLGCAGLGEYDRRQFEAYDSFTVLRGRDGVCRFTASGST
jgi:hypothetical protein